MLVNDAGDLVGAPAEDTPLHGWQKVLDVNLTASSRLAGRRPAG